MGGGKRKYKKKGQSLAGEHVANDEHEEGLSKTINGKSLRWGDVEEVCAFSALLKVLGV
jgi:hypothetical protein